MKKEMAETPDRMSAEEKLKQVNLDRYLDFIAGGRDLMIEIKGSLSPLESVAEKIHQRALRLKMIRHGAYS